MKIKVIFLENEDGDLVTGKVILFILNIFFSFISIFGGKYLHFYFLLIPPFSIFYFGISIYYIIKSIVNHVFELHSLFFLPFIFFVTLGAISDIDETNNIEKKLLDAQNYVEQYYEQNGFLPDNDDPYLAEQKINIRGIDSYDKYAKADEYILNYLEENERFPDKDDPFLAELKVEIEEVESYSKFLEVQKYIEQYHYIYGKAPEENDYSLMGFNPDIFEDEYYYELEGIGAKIRRGDSKVKFRTRR